eukprot:TRINITY_DN2399_c1_g2_i1.p1 TRINITY_DN2399_c1_g2~~TRINITY_DN2399_c1_g2_i1.p1  ORF type:complete len:181 (+),score=24.78 TRINITY_DN2399_c1_g2_i1:39-545(+)
MKLLCIFIVFSIFLTIPVFSFECKDALEKIQYTCLTPELNSFGQPVNCQRGNHYEANCTVRSAVTCTGDRNFLIEKDCYYITGKSYYTSVTLSIFLGILGVDRFYMGYPTIGFIKMFSLGGFGLGWLVDFLLIVTEISTPSDGSVYYNGPHAVKANVNRVDPISIRRY